VVLYSSIQAATLARACALVAKDSIRRSPDSTVECHDSMTALSSADPGLPIDWEMPSRAQAVRKAPAVYCALAALIGVEDRAGHLPAAHRHRHGQRPVGQVRVVMLAQGEPRILARPRPARGPGTARPHRWVSRCRRRTT
jgi:hypothetical protein